MKRIFAIPLAAGMIAAAGCAQAQDPETLFQEQQIDVDASEAELMESTRDLFIQDSMNVFRRFAREDTEQMVKFYTEALGVRSLNPIQLTETSQMILTGVGSGQIKLAAGQTGDRVYNLDGGYMGGTGIRLFTLTYPDEAAVRQRFADTGFELPQFQDQGDGTSAALVTDPGGFPIQIVIEEGAKPNANDGVGVGIAVSDLEESRRFYREFVGLDELPAVEDRLLGVTKYPYQHKETTLYLYEAGNKQSADNGSAGIQYVVSDAALAAAKGAKRNVAVENPLNTLRGFELTTVWLNDPDGVTNYFAQVGNGERQQARR